MTQLLLAVALATQPTQDWNLAAPYKEKAADNYKVQIEIFDQGETINVEMNAALATDKKTDKGFEGSFSWTQLIVDGGQQDDMTFATTLKSDGTLKAVKSDLGDGMRRMLLPFYLSYPGKAVAKDATWTYKDANEDEVDAHKTSIEYKVVAIEKVKEVDTMKVSVKLTESGPDPMKVDGFYWVAADGRVLKYELNLTNWPVPVAAQSFDAKLKAERSN
jgi:hypothetical protein